MFAWTYRLQCRLGHVPFIPRLHYFVKALFKPVVLFFQEFFYFITHGGGLLFDKFGRVAL